MFPHVFVPHRKIDGRVYVGEVKEKEKAKQEYEKAVSTGQTAGLVKYAGMKPAEDWEASAEASLRRDISVLAGPPVGRWRSSLSLSTLQLTTLWSLSWPMRNCFRGNRASMRS